MFKKTFRPSRPSGRFGGQKKHFRASKKSGFCATGNFRFQRGRKFIDPNKFIKKIIVGKEEKVFQPKNSFADFEIHEKLKANIVRQGYERPTPIQDQAIGHILVGRDLIGLANTGTGKTAAFLIPLIHKIFKNRQSRALVITPTRDLASQIDQELEKFSRGSGLFSAVCIGGANFGRQIKDLSCQPHFVIGTPGRLKDLVQRKSLDLSVFDHVVLDEVDRMLDMGFIQEVRWLMGFFPKKRQSLFFSATMPPEIMRLAGEFNNNPVRVEAQTSVTSENVEQDVVRIAAGKEKIEILHELLIQADFQKVLVFGRTKWGVQKLSEKLAERGFRADSIHGNHPQARRERALRKFKAGQINVLVATDVAARGLDIPNVTHVINYDTPENYEDYIHRIGRTGRGNSLGKALTFVES